MEITEEMYRVAEEAYDREGQHSFALEAAFKAVLAIVERDNVITPICGDVLSTPIRCTRAKHERGEHVTSGPGGSMVTWS